MSWSRRLTLLLLFLGGISISALLGLGLIKVLQSLFNSSRSLPLVWLFPVFSLMLIVAWSHYGCSWILKSLGARPLSQGLRASEIQIFITLKKFEQLGRLNGPVNIWLLPSSDLNACVIDSPTEPLAFLITTATLDRLNQKELDMLLSWLLNFAASGSPRWYFWLSTPLALQAGLNKLINQFSYRSGESFWPERPSSFAPLLALVLAPLLWPIRQLVCMALTPWQVLTPDRVTARSDIEKYLLSDLLSTLKDSRAPTIIHHFILPQAWIIDPKESLLDHLSDTWGRWRWTHAPIHQRIRRIKQVSP